jgi:hypothetical protein
MRSRNVGTEALLDVLELVILVFYLNCEISAKSGLAFRLNAEH